MGLQKRQYDTIRYDPHIWLHPAAEFLLVHGSVAGNAVLVVEQQRGMWLPKHSVVPQGGALSSLIAQHLITCGQSTKVKYDTGSREVCSSRGQHKTTR